MFCSTQNKVQQCEVYIFMAAVGHYIVSTMKVEQNSQDFVIVFCASVSTSDLFKTCIV